jgi:hypothetical protein
MRLDGSTLFLGLTGIGCAHVAEAPIRADARHPGSMTIAYEIVRRGDGEGPVLSGRTEIEPGHGAGVEDRTSKSHGSTLLHFDARTHSDGTTLLRIKYDEESGEGARIIWSTAVRVRHGGEAVTAVEGKGWARALRVRLE